MNGSLATFNTSLFSMGNISTPGLVPDGPCAPHEPYSLGRFFLVVVGGTPLATLGLPANLLLFYLLVSDSATRTTVKIYLIALSACDVLTCLLYIALFSIDAFALYFRVESLWKVWHYYAMPGYAMSMITQYTSKYLLVCATIDRFIVVFKMPQCFCYYRTKYGRVCTITTVVMFAIAMGLPSTWDYSIVDDSQANCTDPFDTLSFERYLVTNKFYDEVYKFYILTTVVTFVPFVLLLLLNVLIVGNIRKDLIDNSNRKKRIKQEKLAARSSGQPRLTGIGDNKLTELIQDAMMRSRLNAATYTTSAIVSIFLVCTALDIFIKTLERLFPVPVLMQEDGTSTDFYRYSTDIISILFVFNSFLRLVICKACDPHIRSQYHKAMRRLCQMKKSRNSLPGYGSNNEMRNLSVSAVAITSTTPTRKSLASSRWHKAYDSTKNMPSIININKQANLIDPTVPDSSKDNNLVPDRCFINDIDCDVINHLQTVDESSNLLEIPNTP